MNIISELRLAQKRESINRPSKAQLWGKPTRLKQSGIERGSLLLCVERIQSPQEIAA